MTFKPNINYIEKLNEKRMQKQGNNSRQHAGERSRLQMIWQEAYLCPEFTQDSLEEQIECKRYHFYSVIIRPLQFQIIRQTNIGDKVIVS